MQFYKLPIVADLEANSTSHSNWHAEIFKTRIIHIKEWNAKFNLDNLSEIDVVNLGLEWGTALISQTNNARQNRKVRSFDDLIVGANNEILHGAIFLLIHKNSNFAIFDTEGGTPSYRIFTDIFS